MSFLGDLDVWFGGGSGVRMMIVIQGPVVDEGEEMLELGGYDVRE